MNPNESNNLTNASTSATIEPWEPSRRISASIAQNHPCVDYVVLSEFDIDVGSTVRHQYPAAIPTVSPDWLAEHCIPEGIHARESDSTFLRQSRITGITDRAIAKQGQC